jgi:serine/threonine protein kinase
MDVDSGSLVSGPLRRVGRYALFDCVGHGATATVHIGRLLGPAGFSKTVAIKRMHENVGRDPEVAAMFLDEARLSGRIRHPNVVATTDLLAMDGETFLVMEYVHGDSLSSLSDALRARGERMPHAIAVHVMRDVLNGLHAAHEAQDELGRPLHLVHRDVSPHNIQLGIDGSARVLDFGIAKALGRLQDTHLGQVKGKLAYMAPEQLLGQPFDRRVDVFAAGVVLWETLAGRRLFFSDNPGQTVQRILSEDVPDLASVVPFISPTLARAVAKATARLPEQRFATALEFAHELEHAAEIVTPRLVGEWIRRTAGDKLEQRARRLRQIECTPIVDVGIQAPIAD